MPTPYGIISTSEGPVSAEEPTLSKTFKVTVTYSVRRVTNVEATTAAEAEGKVLDIINQYDSDKEDVLISNYQSEVKEL